ncbi:hypothetical protein CAEBREN_22837 [Caenorhabditis brenneri]|uniref:Uncharacterized protein n=1 Tax=Caenorhabditis brenneri TaxID=135651 RepID=G0NF34_CAEBE|nr:hypothetical protein CAEBREN_22837 [Caenorhabditis brenneri]
MISVLFLFSTLVLARAAIPACNGAVKFQQPVDTTQTTWYPSEFTGSDAPAFPDQYTCEYQIDVPQGMFVSVQLTVNISNPQGDGTVNVVDQLQRTEKVLEAFQESYYFVSSGGKIKLSSARSGIQFGFSLNWQKLPKIDPTVVQVNVNDTRPYILDKFDNQGVTFTASGKVSATITPPPYDYYKQFFRGIIFFDGTSAISACIGTGLQLSDGQTQYVSSGNQLTVMNLGSSYSYVHIGVQLQDYENTKSIVQFQALKIDDDQPYAVYTLNPANGPVALQSCCDDDDMDVLSNIIGTGNVDVYSGGVTKRKSNVLVSYSATNNNPNLPQLFGGRSKTYVVSGGPVTLNITRNYKTFTNTVSGRKGFLASGDYGVVSSNQDVIVTLFAPVQDDQFFTTNNMFRFSIQFADLVPGVSFNISCFDQGKYTRLTYNSANLPSINSVIEWHGSQLQIDYESNGQYNKGMFLNFETYTSSSSGFSMFFKTIVSQPSV